jgi:hypothetical protein
MISTKPIADYDDSHYEFQITIFSMNNSVISAWPIAQRNHYNNHPLPKPKPNPDKINIQPHTLQHEGMNARQHD